MFILSRAYFFLYIIKQFRINWIDWFNSMLLSAFLYINFYNVIGTTHFPCQQMIVECVSNLHSCIYLFPSLCLQKTVLFFSNLFRNRDCLTHNKYSVGGSFVNYVTLKIEFF
jgi:hypothetical protein